MIKSWMTQSESCPHITSRPLHPYEQGHLPRTLRGLVVSLLVALTVCSGVSFTSVTADIGEAEAQSTTGQRGKLIETYMIDPASFALVTNAVPSIEVKDGVTIYTLVSQATVSFTTTETSGSVRIQVDAEDMIIERPETGSVTVVRDR